MCYHINVICSHLIFFPVKRQPVCVLVLWDDRSFSFYESVSLTDPQSSKGKASPVLFEAQQHVFPSKLASVAVNSKAGLPKRWKYLALLCTRNTRSKRCFSSVVTLIIFVKPELHLDSVGFEGAESTGDELSVAEGDKEGPQMMTQSRRWLCILPICCWSKRVHGVLVSLDKSQPFWIPLCCHCSCRGF